MILPLGPRHRRTIFIAAGSIVLSSAGVPAQRDSLPTIRRTEFGVPHILASDYRGVGIGLGYTQTEDYGDRVIRGLVRSKGWMGRTFGRDSMQSDFLAQRKQMRVQETYHLLDAGTRGIYEGFAEGVNIYIRTHPERVPEWAAPVFTGHDVAALDVQNANTTNAQRIVLRRLQRDTTRNDWIPAHGDSTLARADGIPAEDDRPSAEKDPDVGSNAWALAPSRTKSGRAILLRNPHLAWSSGYWEAHVTIPGTLNYYGDFRIGGPFTVIGGFNDNLGWSTTNNVTDPDEIYELEADTARADHYIFDGVSVPLRSESVTVEYATPDGFESETREFWTTALGPVVHRTSSSIYIVRSAIEGEYRAGQQFLRMMLARNLAEWREALAMRARSTSNFTYADRAGNIFYIWMGSIPRLPHASGGDTTFIPARGSADIWTSLVHLDSLPQLLNPKGGYLHNENDAPYYSNLHQVLDTLRYPPYIERPDFGLRSQHAISLIDNRKKFSLEEVVQIKHSMKMLLADRVKPDLVAAVRASAPDTALANAAEFLESWDNTVAPDSRGGLLFETWWRRYMNQARGAAFAEEWTPSKLVTTPRGLGRPDLAVEALGWAVDDMKQRYGTIDVAWGDVHRVRRGNLDIPVGGCSGALGCFRVISYAQAADGKRIANSGDGWVIAVEFGRQVPRAYSILAYGQTPDPTSPHHADQSEMFARGEMKKVRYTEADIRAGVIREYRPGER